MVDMSTVSRQMTNMPRCLLEHSYPSSVDQVASWISSVMDGLGL